MKTGLIIGGAVVVAGGFAFWLYHRHAVAAAAVAAAASAAAPRAAPRAGILDRTAGFVGGVGGAAAGFLAPIPGIGRPAGAAATALASGAIHGTADTIVGVKDALTGHPVDAAKSIGKGAVAIAAAPVHAISSVLHSIF